MSNHAAASHTDNKGIAHAFLDSLFENEFNVVAAGKKKHSEAFMNFMINEHMPDDDDGDDI